MADIYAFLAEHTVSFQKFEHPAVYTCEEAEELTPDMPGLATKNLLLRNRKGDRHILVVVGHDKSADLKKLGEVLQESKLPTLTHGVSSDTPAASHAKPSVAPWRGAKLGKLSFASPERLKDRLGLEPGAVTLLGLINDPEHNVDLVIDEAMWNADAIQCHPLVNTATLVIGHEGIEKFLQATGHTPQILEVPAR